MVVGVSILGQWLKSSGGIVRNYGVRGEQHQVFGDGLSHQGAIERVMVNGRQSIELSDVLWTPQQRQKVEISQRFCPPGAWIAYLQCALHGLDHHFPIDDYAQVCGAAIERAAYRFG